MFGQFDKTFPLKRTFTNETKNSAWYDRKLRRLVLETNFPAELVLSKMRTVTVLGGFGGMLSGKFLKICIL